MAPADTSKWLNERLYYHCSHCQQTLRDKINQEGWVLLVPDLVKRPVTTPFPPLASPLASPLPLPRPRPPPLAAPLSKG
jgi:hypothetical protein